MKQKAFQEGIWQHQTACDNLKPIDAHKIAQDVLCVKQRMFEVRDKTSKQLAWMLSDVSGIIERLNRGPYKGC